MKLRKLVGFLLNNMENRLQPCKADLSSAFNKWKFFTGETKTELKATTRNEQQHLYVNNVRIPHYLVTHAPIFYCLANSLFLCFLRFIAEQTGKHASQDGDNRGGASTHGNVAG